MLLIFQLISFWSENILYNFSFAIWRYLWLSTLYILRSILFVLKNMYSDFVGFRLPTCFIDYIGCQCSFATVISITLNLLLLRYIRDINKH